MNQEDNKYFIFTGLVIFFLLAGFYLVFNLLFNSAQFGIFSGLISTSVEEPARIETVNLSQDVFMQPSFKELEMSKNYEFKADGLAVGKKNLFESELENTGEKK